MISEWKTFKISLEDFSYLLFSAGIIFIDTSGVSGAGKKPYPL
jgi:hypothetical protein